MLSKKLYFLLFLLGFSISLYAQTIHIEGIIQDKQSGEALAEATVYIKETGNAVTSDQSGKYSCRLKKGSYTLIASYIGYKNEEIRIKADRDQTVPILLESSTELQEVIVSAKAKDENVSRISMGVERLTATEIKRIPALMGEVDVIKAIQLLPGVQSASEGGSGFSVRGGSPDQNLILLDNSTVYNAAHLMGFFSVFNNDVLSGLELYKGDLPLKFGGRLSSLLDVQTKTDQPERFQGTGGIGLISSRLMLEGPIGEKTSWMIGGRRSYADLFLKLSNDESQRDAALYFYDVNAKLSHRFSGKDKVEGSVYLGRDLFGAQPGEFKYSNAAGSLSWGHTFSDRLFSKFSLHLTNYDYGLKSKLEDAEAAWDASIFDVMLRADFNQPLSDLWNLGYGVSTIHHHFQPGVVTMPDYPGLKVEGNNALEHGIYLSNEQKLSDRLSLKYGLRVSVFQNMGKALVYSYDNEYEVSDSTRYKSGEIYHTYTGLEPRLGFVYKLTDYSSVKGNYAHNTQYMQLANNSASGSPLDIWFPASPNIKPQRADLFSLGYFHNLKENSYETSVEVYYKGLKNVVDFAEHAELMLNDKLEGEVRTGTGKAYGAEFMVKKNTGRLTGFVNYTLSRSERTIPEINQGKTYLAPYDKTHSVNIVANYQLSEKVSLSTVWVYATGNPTSYPSGRFEIGGEYFPIYSGRNEFRKPDYHRLDLSLTYIPNPKSKKRWQGEWNFSLYNAYWQKNPWMITFDQDDVSGLPHAEMIYLFGIIPSITYNFKF
ncbi:TonB-dependent receptor [Parabacteroides sp. Marseille-P3160]|uniref:TonB-dependent receptor n=1 Tax=Parabacteroides sp. Marseille-P3160 TaxID=1917887 RepID=UPI0009B95DB8|nr:TonB-dependent receptor [Parabacteroides sp. Marseille-P3160]